MKSTAENRWRGGQDGNLRKEGKGDKLQLETTNMEKENELEKKTK